jgi:putative PIN family toxin of toxin-antitoxin system
MRAVFDTNVLVAAYLTEGLCARLLRRARQHQFELIICPHILKEFRDNLKKLTSPLPEVLGATMGQLKAITALVTPPARMTPQVCRDPTDNIILGCALAAQADYLVTGDHDLLDLHPFHNLSIVSPRDFELLFAN